MKSLHQCFFSSLFGFFVTKKKNNSYFLRSKISKHFSLWCETVLRGVSLISDERSIYVINVPEGKSAAGPWGSSSGTPAGESDGAAPEVEGPPDPAHWLLKKSAI